LPTQERNVASTNVTDYTFYATDYDPKTGAEACGRLAEAFAGGREPRSSDIREAMASATAAFPGLHDFVDAMAERDLDPEDAMLDLSGIAAEHHGRRLEAAAKLALIGAIAEAAERFEWQDVVDCASFCREALAEPPVPGGN
jgi:hypothetical protein